MSFEPRDYLRHILLETEYLISQTPGLSFEAFIANPTLNRAFVRSLEIIGGCFRHQLLLPRPYLVLTKPLRLDIQCQRGASVKIGWKYLDD